MGHSALHLSVACFVSIHIVVYIRKNINTVLLLKPCCLSMLISCYNCADILYSSFFSLHCLLPSSSSSFPHSSSFPLYSPAFFLLSSFCLCLPLRYYTLPRPGIASPLPPSCSATASAASSPPTPTCSIRSTCHPPSRCRTVRSPRHTRDPAPCSSATPNSRWSSTASR